jgi:hypothetical protein
MMSEASTTDYEIAVERVVGFLQQFDRAHFDLACHAAFPLVITPDLLYKYGCASYQKHLGQQLLAYFYLVCAVR